MFYIEGWNYRKLNRIRKMNVLPMGFRSGLLGISYVE